MHGIQLPTMTNPNVPTEEDAQADAVVVARVLKGDISAFAVLVRRYEAGVWRTISVLLRDDATIENLTQQAFLEAYESLGRFKNDAAFGPWINGIARNMVKEQLRVFAREQKWLRRYYESLNAELSSGGEVEVDEATRAALQRCCESLAPTAYRAIELRYVQGLPIDAVARTLGRSLVATKQLLFRIRATLRQCLHQVAGRS